MTPYAVYAMLACARLGAVHTVVFAGFSSEALQARIKDAECRVVITADEGLRGGKVRPAPGEIQPASLCLVWSKGGAQDVGWRACDALRAWCALAYPFARHRPGSH
jgi:acyl-coenzyme A synthetase/AMP-(fatty) acid ligase